MVTGAEGQTWLIEMAVAMHFIQSLTCLTSTPERNAHDFRFPCLSYNILYMLLISRLDQPQDSASLHLQPEYHKVGSVAYWLAEFVAWTKLTHVGPG